MYFKYSNTQIHKYKLLKYSFTKYIWLQIQMTNYLKVIK